MEIPDIQIPELPYETFCGLGDLHYPMTVDQALGTVAPNIANYHDEFLRMCDVHVDDVDDEIDDAPDPKRQCGEFFGPNLCGQDIDDVIKDDMIDIERLFKDIMSSTNRDDDLQMFYFKPMSLRPGISPIAVVVVAVWR